MPGWWKRLRCLLGFHPGYRETEQFVDYYHDRFRVYCTQCGRCVSDRTLYGDWG